jgi:hypothetical protein
MNVVDRAWQLIQHPKREWEAIAAEKTTVQELYTGYIMILAAIPAISHFIGFSIVGTTTLGGSYRVPIANGLAHMVSQYVLTLGLIYVFGVLIDVLAPHFGGEKDFPQSFKVAAYAPTAAWLAGVFHMVPLLSIFGLLGLYSLYCSTRRADRQAHPEDKAVPFVVLVLIMALVSGVLISTLASMMVPTAVRGF